MLKATDYTLCLCVCVATRYGEMQSPGRQKTPEKWTSPSFSWGKKERNKVILCLSTLTHFWRVSEVWHYSLHLSGKEIQINGKLKSKEIDFHYTPFFFFFFWMPAVCWVLCWKCWLTLMKRWLTISSSLCGSHVEGFRKGINKGNIWTLLLIMYRALCVKGKAL